MKNVFKLKLNNLVLAIVLAALTMLASASAAVSVGSTYTLAENNSGRLATASTENVNWSDVKSVTDQSWSSQQWKLEDAGSGYFRIKNIWSGMYITAKNADNWSTIVQSQYEAWTSQQWDFEQISGNRYRIKNRYSGKYLTSQNDNWWDLVTVSWGGTATDNQLWNFVLVGGTAPSGTMKIMPLGDSFTYGTIENPNEDANYGGYRKVLNQRLSENGKNYDFVGSQSHGGFSDNQNEGHEGWVCDFDIINSDPGYGDGLYQYIDNWQSTYDPDMVLLSVGINDIYSGFDISPEAAADAQKRLMEKMLGNNPDLIIVVTKQLPWPEMITLNGELETIVNDLKSAGHSVYLTDVFVGFNDYQGSGGHKYGNHPNEAGYDVMGENWFNAIKDLF